jgi:transcriptional regulator with XRE-family HTH domain
MKTASDILNKYMDLMDIGRDELHRRSGVSKSLISKIKTGERPNPGREVMKRLADAMALPPTIWFE